MLLPCPVKCPCRFWMGLVWGQIRAILGGITWAVATGHLHLSKESVSLASHLLVPVWVGVGELEAGQGEGRGEL